MTPNPDRRAFFRSLTTAAAAPVLAQFLEVEEALATELRTLDSGPAPLAGPQVLRDRYLLDPRVTYLNHASIGTVPEAVHSAGMRYRQICEENPWLYIWGGAWEEAREAVRADAALLLGCTPEEVAITHNTTEGFNLFAQGLPLGPEDEVLFSSLNHAGASICWDHFGNALGYSVRRFEFPLDEAPTLTSGEIVEIHEAEIRDETRVLVFPHLDNIVGIRHPMEALTSMARSRGVEFVLVDGAQTAGMIPLQVADSGVDGFATSPHKWIQSPKGLGLLYVRKDLVARLRPLWVTWGQARWEGSARRFEDYGTRDLPEVLSLGDALRFQRSLGPNRKENRYQEMFRDFRDAVDASSELTWRSPRRWEMGGMLTTAQLRTGGAENASERLFEEYGIVVRPFPQEGLNCLRVSPNLLNSQEEMNRLIQILEVTRNG